MARTTEQMAEYIRLRQEVSKLWVPTPAETEDLIEGYFKAYRSNYFSSAPETHIPDLKQLKIAISKNLGRPPSAPMLTSSLLFASFDLVTNMVHGEFYNGRNAPEFSLLSDVHWAADYIPMIIYQGEVELMGKFDEVLDATAVRTREVSDEEITIFDEVELYLQDIETAKQAVSLLKENNTGCKLVEEMAKRIKGLPSRISQMPYIPPYRIPEFLAVGADLAVDYYKVIYQVAKTV